MLLRGFFLQLIWLVPRLLSMVVGAMVLLSTLTTPGGDLSDEPAQLPRLLQLRAPDLRWRVEEALRDLRHEGAQAARGARTLAALGAAALPHVLPQLDGLEPSTRSRTATALVPIAKRMGIFDTSAEDPSRAAAFWRSTWEARGAEFRPGEVRSAVHRLLRYPSPIRMAQVRTYDTFALEFLVEALRTPEDETSKERARLLFDLLSDITEREDRLGARATLDDAKACHERWQRWWSDHRLRFVALDPSGRIAAALLETRLGRWLKGFARAPFGVDDEGRPTGGQLGQRAWVTAVGVASMLFLSSAIALLARLRRPEARELLQSEVRTIAVVLALSASAVTWIPALCWLPWPKPLVLLGSLGAGSIFLASLALLSTRPWLESTSAGHLFLAWEARGASRPAVLRTRLLRRARPTLLAVAGRWPLTLPLALGLQCLFEVQLGLSGWGPYFVGAVREGKSSPLACMILLTALCAAVARAFAELLGDWLALGPRVPSSKRLPAP